MLRDAALVLVVAALAWFLWPSSLGGCTTVTIVSGHSMEPTYVKGDLVVSRCGEPRVGDVVVYRPAGENGGRVIHRVVGGDASSGWRMQGDNNDFTDPWMPRGAEVLGIARVHVPYAGTLAAVLLSPLTWASVLVLGGALLLWPGRDEAQEGDAQEGEAQDAGARDDGTRHDERAGRDECARPDGPTRFDGRTVPGGRTRSDGRTVPGARTGSDDRTGPDGLTGAGGGPGLDAHELLRSLPTLGARRDPVGEP